MGSFYKLGEDKYLNFNQNDNWIKISLSEVSMIKRNENAISFFISMVFILIGLFGITACNQAAQDQLAKSINETLESSDFVLPNPDNKEGSFGAFISLKCEDKCYGSGTIMRYSQDGESISYFNFENYYFEELQSGNLGSSIEYFDPNTGMNNSFYLTLKDKKIIYLDDSFNCLDDFLSVDSLGFNQFVDQKRNSGNYIQELISMDGSKNISACNI